MVIKYIHRSFSVNFCVYLDIFKYWKITLFMRIHSFWYSESSNVVSVDPVY